jgi:hypothetical protein
MTRVKSLSALLLRQPSRPWRAAILLALLASLYALTAWAVDSVSEQVNASQREMARHARQQTLVASLQEHLMEARRVEMALTRPGADREAAHERWNKAVAGARRTLISLAGITVAAERGMAQEALGQLSSYMGLLDRVWLPAGEPGSPPNPAPLVARAGDHMIGLLQNTVYLGTVARTRTEAAEEASRAVLRTASGLGATVAAWAVGSLVISGGVLLLGFRSWVMSALRRRPKGGFVDTFIDTQAAAS